MVGSITGAIGKLSLKQSRQSGSLEEDKHVKGMGESMGRRMQMNLGQCQGDLLGECHPVRVWVGH